MCGNTLKFKRIVADGDWDGVVATGLLLRVFNLPFYFPHPPEIPKLRLNRVIAIEVGPTKVEAITNSLIIDHHALSKESETNETLIDLRYKSAASLVADHWALDYPSNWREVIESIDSGQVTSSMGQTVWKAFLIDIEHFPRRWITRLVNNGKWEKIEEWCEERAIEYDINTKTKMEELLARAAKLGEDAVWFWFALENKNEWACKTPTMLKLENEFNIVIALAMTEDKVMSGTLGTKKVNLLPIFEGLRTLGYNAGGRETIGGFQCLDIKSVYDVVQDLKTVLAKVNYNVRENKT